MGWDMGKLALILLFLPEGISNSESEQRQKEKEEKGKVKLLNFKYDWTDAAHTGGGPVPFFLSLPGQLLLGIWFLFLTYCS